jgi:Domain of unknown function (DUF4390)
VPRFFLLRHHLVLALVWLLLAPAPVAAQSPGIELASLSVHRLDGELVLDFEAPVTLSKTVQEAMERGLPVYFVARADLYRGRWYWRDERIARVQRVWRVAYQPLTSNWRVGFGGFNQTFPSLGEALSVVSRSSRWKVIELSQLDPDSQHYIDFSYGLDTSQLPSPMQIGLGGQSDWSIGVERTLRVDPPP